MEWTTLNFQSKFEEPYEDIDFPFYISLGNHDYGGDCGITDCGGIGNEFERSEAQIAYSDISDKWILPDVYYTFVQEHVQFLCFGHNCFNVGWLVVG